MLLRPGNAVWFEMLIARDDLVSTLRCFAAGGHVELESHSVGSAAQLLPKLRAALGEYRRLVARYARYLPSASALSADPHAEPEAISDAALGHLRAWAAAADPLILQVHKLQHEREELAPLEQLLSQARVPLPDFDLLHSAGPLFASRIYLLESKGSALTVPTSVLAHRVDFGERSYLLAVAPRDHAEALDAGLHTLNARRLELPSAGIGSGAEDALTRLEARLAEIARVTQRLHARLREYDIEHRLDAALADMALIEWLASHVPEFSRSDYFVRISGWARDLSSRRRLEASLRRAGIHCLLHFPAAPPGLTPPIVLRNPRWARPFELFARLLGTPGANEADPSVLLALLAPLMFGFMFGDVGQGAVLVLAGFALRKRYPATELLISGGAAAMLFGALFGSVFAGEHIFPALWFHPLQRPLTLLEVTLVGGSVVILIGLALDAVESYWGGHLSRWWGTRAGLVLSYLGSLAIAIDGRAAALIAIGIGWYCLGEVAQAEHRVQRLGKSIAEAIQTLLQLLVNTLSFVRVGAFALAHAGLATAINALAAGIGARSVAILVFVLGNVLVILIEGLVVSIQTARLVLFEFFIRFLCGYGRAFRPLGLPTAVTIELSRKSP